MCRRCPSPRALARRPRHRPVPTIHGPPVPVAHLLRRLLVPAARASLPSKRDLKPSSTQLLARVRHARGPLPISHRNFRRRIDNTVFSFALARSMLGLDRFEPRRKRPLDRVAGFQRQKEISYNQLDVVIGRADLFGSRTTCSHDRRRPDRRDNGKRLTCVETRLEVQRPRSWSGLPSCSHTSSS